MIFKHSADSDETNETFKNIGIDTEIELKNRLFFGISRKKFEKSL